MKTRFALLSFALFVAGGIGLAEAGPVTWGFEGVVTLIEDRNDVLGGAVEVGSLLSGYYTFESTTPTISPGDGVYDNALTDVFGAVGGTAFSGPIGTFNRIYVFNGISSPDSYVVVTGLGFAGTIAFLQIVLDDRTGAMFESNALPLVPPALSAIDADGARFALGTLDETLGINGTITRLVPEPGTAGLLAIAVLSLVIRRRTLRFETNRTRRPDEGFRVDRTTVFLALILGSVVCAVAQDTYASHDCNGNFIDDSTEIADCPDFDLVFLLDSSNSTRNNLADVCTAGVALVGGRI